MFGYLINPNDRTVKAVEYSGDYKDIYKLIDASTFDCADIDFDPDTLAEKSYEEYYND